MIAPHFLMVSPVGLKFWNFLARLVLPRRRFILRLVASRKLSAQPHLTLSRVFWAASSRRSPLQAALRTNNRFMFQAMVTRLHSPRAFSSPRIEN